MQPEQQFQQCPNDACTNHEDGTIIFCCRACGGVFCYKVGVYCAAGCARDGRCPHCRRSMRGAHRLGYVLNERPRDGYGRPEPTPHTARLRLLQRAIDALRQLA